MAEDFIIDVDGMRSSSAVKDGWVKGANRGLFAVKYSVIDGLAICEGDIVLGSAARLKIIADALLARPSLRNESDLEPFGITISTQFARWKNRTIPYRIFDGMPGRERVTDAIAHWKAMTGLNFIERTILNRNEFLDFVTFTPSDSCWSNVGRQGGEQFIGLGPNCHTGNCIHEIGHAVGLWHEQSREDRDEHVTIHLDNILEGHEHNFDQQITDGDDVNAYDFASIMHYPKNAFAKDKTKDTITPPQGQIIGQRDGLSPGDVLAVKSMYP